MNIQEVYNKVVEYSSADIQELERISNESVTNGTIPKIVHFCFLDYRNMTERHLNYLKTWFEILGDDWTFVNWTPELTEPSCEFERYTYEKNKFAFYADYIRCKKVYEYGGVYMDCDVKLLKPLDPLLDLDYCFDTERGQAYFECGVFMAKKNNVFLKYIKDAYEKATAAEYESDSMKFLAPIYWRDVLAKKGVTVGINSTKSIEEYRENLANKYDHILYALDGTFMSCQCGKDIWTGEIWDIKDHTFSSHGFEGTWSY